MRRPRQGHITRIPLDAARRMQGGIVIPNPDYEFKDVGTEVVNGEEVSHRRNYEFVPRAPRSIPWAYILCLTGGGVAVIVLMRWMLWEVLR